MKNNKKAYSVIIALLLTGFLLVVVVGVFNLILKELNDNKGMGNYLKTFFGAEAAQELALLKIKDTGYGYNDVIDLDVNDRSIILANSPTDTSLFELSNDVMISYDLSPKSNDYNGVLDELGYDIIPLYYLTGTTNIIEEKVKDLQIEIISGTESDLVWNIIGSQIGISGTGVFDGDTTVNVKSNDTSGFELNSKSIEEFLDGSDTNFLVLLNSGNDTIEYNIKAKNSGEYFSKPEIKIFSSAKLGKYRQNLSTDFDNTEYFKVVKYSIFSK